MSETKAATPEAIVDVLTERGFLFELRISQWSGRARLTEADLGLEGLTRDDLHRLGQRQLVPRAELAKISAIGTRARERLGAVSYKFPIGSARFLPAAVVAPLLADLARIRADFIAAVTAFDLAFETLAEAHRAEWRENAQRIKAANNLSDEWLAEFDARLLACYPPADEVRGEFGMEWSLFQFALPRGVRAKLVDAEQALEAARLADEARRQVEQQVAAFVGEAAVELRRRAGETCANVARQIAENGEKLSERSLAPVREMIAQFRALDFTGDDGFAAELERFQAEILGAGKEAGVAKQARESADYRETLGAALRGLADRALGDTAKASQEALERFLSHGRTGRKLAPEAAS